MVFMQSGEKELIMLRAIHHAQHEEFDKAIACIQLILDDDPYDMTAWFNKAHTLRLSGRTDEAYTLLSWLYKECPDRADICFELGMLAKESGNIKEAEKFFLTCISIEPLSSIPRVVLGTMFFANIDCIKAK